MTPREIAESILQDRHPLSPESELARAYLAIETQNKKLGTLILGYQGARSTSEIRRLQHTVKIEPEKT